MWHPLLRNLLRLHYYLDALRTPQFPYLVSPRPYLRPRRPLHRLSILTPKTRRK